MRGQVQGDRVCIRMNEELEAVSSINCVSNETTESLRPI